ncbi:serine-rich adhesin for platelets-like [Littorina saxatilis]|uniref:Uncharacterized protein n=1 Tax=Littorina saxatilis TaxID=31220 RepID=A0AAN9ASU9_9CAEN
MAEDDDDVIDLDAVDEEEGNSLPLLPDGEEGEKELVIHVPEETARTAEIGALAVLAAIIVIASAIALIVFVLDRRRRRKVLEVVDKLEKTEEGGSAPRGGHSFDTNDTATTVTTEQSDLNTLSPETPLLQDNSNNNRRRDRNANASLDRRERRCCMCFCCPPENEPSLEDLWKQKKTQQQTNANNARTGSAKKSLKLMEEGMTHMEGFQNFLNRKKSSSADKTTRHKPNLHRRHRSERLLSAQRSASYPQHSPSPKASRRKSYSNTNESCWSRASASQGERLRSHSHSLANRSHNHPCRHNQNGHHSISPTPHRSTRTGSLDQRYRSHSQHRGDARSKSLDQNHSGRNKSSDRHHSGRAVSPEKRRSERRSSLGRQLAEHPCSLRSKSGERNNDSVEKRHQSSRPRSIGRHRSESNEHHRGQRTMNVDRQRGSSGKRLCSGKFQSTQDKRVVPSDRHSGMNRSQNQSSHRHSRHATSPHHHHHHHNHSHRHNERDSPSGSPERKSRRRDRCHDSPSQDTFISYRTSHTSNNPKKSCGSCRNRGLSARQYVGGRDRCKENDRRFDSRSAGSYSNSRQNYPEYPQSRQRGSHGQVTPSARYENRNHSATQPFTHSTPNIAAQNKFGTSGLVQGNLGASGLHQYTPGASRLSQQNTSAYHVGQRNSYDPGIAQDSNQASGVGRNHTYGPGVVQNNHHISDVGHDNPYTGVPQENSYASGMSQTHHQSSRSGQNAAQSSWVNSARSTGTGQYDPRVNQNNPNASSVAENMRNASNVGQNNPYTSGVSQVQAQRTIPSTFPQRPNPQRHYEGQYFNSQDQRSQMSYENSRGHNPQWDHPAQYPTQYPANEPPHYQYRYPHLNVSQNYNCEESDSHSQSGDTHSAPVETKQTVSPAVRKAEQEMSEGHNDEHSDPVASTSRAKLSCSRKKRFFRPCKRSPTPRFMLKHKHKHACTSTGLAGRFQETDTSSDESLCGKDDTVSLVQKLFGLKLKSRKRPKRSRSFLSRKKPRKVEHRPLLGRPGFFDSEDTTHETSNETEQMDSEFEVSDILPADSGYSAPTTVQVVSAYDVFGSLPSETRRNGLVSSDPSPAILERRSGSVWHGSVVFPSWKEDTVSVRRRKNSDRGKNIVFPNRPVEALQEPSHLLLMSDSLDAFAETELTSNSRTLSVRMDERKHKQRLHQDGSETPTSYSEGMVCVDLNSVDLRALASGDDKEFRILATQRWCEQQSLAALRSPALSQAEEESVATDTPGEQRSDLSVTVSSRTTDVFTHQTGSSMQDRVSYGDELSHRVNTANAADVSFQGSLPTAHTESISQDIDYMDFRASSNNSRAASDGGSELCDNSTPVPSQSSHSECSDLFDEFAQQRLNQYEQNRDLFSTDTAETNTVNVSESPECTDDRDSLEHGQHLVNGPKECVDAESPDTSLEEAQVLTEEIRHQNISAGTSYHSLQKEIDQDSCSLNTSRKCPFPSESRTFEAFQPSEERQSSHLSLSVIPPCVFHQKT